MSDNKPDRFVQGFACACAIHAHFNGQINVGELFLEGGFSIEDLVTHEVDEHDADLIKEALGNS